MMAKFRHVCGVCSGELWLARKNNCLLSSIFPAGEGGFGQMVYRSPERSPQDSRDGFFLYIAQASFSWPRVDLARPLRRACSRSFGIISFEFVKVCEIRLSIWESFIGFLYLLLFYLYDADMFIYRWSSKKLCWKGAWRRRWLFVSPTLYIIIVYRVNLNKLSRNFVGALRTTTTNCRVSFIDLYLVFPRNFRMIFLPHTNTVILLEPYCGTITEPGLPVVGLSRLCSATFGVWSNFFRF